MMQRMDVLMRKNESKDEEIAHLRERLKQRADVAEEQERAVAKTTNHLTQLKRENFDLVK